MIINNKSIQFNYKLNNYKSIDDVPYWKVYLIKRTKYCDHHGKHTRNEVQYACGNLTFDEVGYALTQITVPKNHILVAYPRKHSKRTINGARSIYNER